MKTVIQFISSACERLHNKIISLIPYYDETFDRDDGESIADYYPFECDDGVSDGGDGTGYSADVIPHQQSSQSSQS